MRLGRSVVVIKPAPRQPPKQLGDRAGHLELLASGHHLEERRCLQPFAPLFGEGFGQLLERHRGEKQPFDLPLAKELEQGVGIAAHLVRDEHQAAAGAPGREHLLEGDVERERGELERPQAPWRRRRELPGDEVDQRAVGHRHPLRPPRRARGEEDVGQVLLKGESRRPRSRSGRRWPPPRHRGAPRPLRLGSSRPRRAEVVTRAARRPSSTITASRSGG